MCGTHSTGIHLAMLKRLINGSNVEGLLLLPKINVHCTELMSILK